MIGCRVTGDVKVRQFVAVEVGDFSFDAIAEKGGGEMPARRVGERAASVVQQETMVLAGHRLNRQNVDIAVVIDVDEAAGNRRL